MLRKVILLNILFFCVLISAQNGASLDAVHEKNSEQNVFANALQRGDHGNEANWNQLHNLIINNGLYNAFQRSSNYENEFAMGYTRASRNRNSVNAANHEINDNQLNTGNINQFNNQISHHQNKKSNSGNKGSNHKFGKIIGPGFGFGFNNVANQFQNGNSANWNQANSLNQRNNIYSAESETENFENGYARGSTRASTNENSVNIANYGLANQQLNLGNFNNFAKQANQNQFLNQANNNVLNSFNQGYQQPKVHPQVYFPYFTYQQPKFGYY